MAVYNKLWLISLSVIGTSCLMLVWQGIGATSAPRFLMVIASAILSWYACSRRDHFETSLGRTAVTIVHGVSLFAAISFAGAIATYALAARSTGWVDAPLRDLDLAIGFDWLALYRVWTSHPLLMALGRTAYTTISLTPLLLVAGLVLYRREDVLQRFMVTFAVALAITVAIFAVAPAKDAFAHLLGDRAGYLPITRDLHVHVIEALRSRTFGAVDIAAVIGLIGFPSFHTTAGVLFAWAAWSIPVYRVPLLALNAALIAATPIEGAHYLVEVIAGGAVAAISIALCTYRVPQDWRVHVQLWWAPSRARPGTVGGL
ncbi:phosphatase PAP2 family protein [Novosphingobium sp. BL-52-GroH]|uniref:phosphatase PAP2 family protein n=1 Tax=Novosphingobium sp. BL-52-GroH TaxID=3349877 RepID=UPI00384BEB3C